MEDTTPIVDLHGEPAKITRERVVEKFEELRAKYDIKNSGAYMITTIPDSIAASFIETAPNSIWKKKYKYNVSEKVPILCAIVEVELFGRKFEVHFDRPFKPDHHAEFEDYFGFGGHCKRYTDKRIIACFPRSPVHDDVNNGGFNVTEFLLTVPAGNAIDDDYVKRALALLVMGGYVKYWDAYYEFSAWFTSFGTFPGANVKAQDVILPYIFEHMVPMKPNDNGDGDDDDADDREIGSGVPQLNDL
jgi:hypothetical protein